MDEFQKKNFYRKVFEKYVGGTRRASRENPEEIIGECPFCKCRDYESFRYNPKTGNWKCLNCKWEGNFEEFRELTGDKAKEELGIRDRTEKEVIESIERQEWRNSPFLKNRKPLSEKETKSTNENTAEEELKIVKTVKYLDINGNLIYQKHFYNDGSFWINYGETKITWGEGEEQEEEGIRRILYNLPALRFNPDIIYLTEEEEQADLLNEVLPESVDNIAVLSFDQPDIEITERELKYFEDKIVYIFKNYDREKANEGDSKIDKLIEILKTTVKQIFVVSFDDVVPSNVAKYSITDWLAEGNTLEDALKLAKLVYERNFEEVSLKDLFYEELPQREYIDTLWNIPKGVLGLIAGMGSVGKGYFLLWNSIRWKVMGHNVAILTAEDDRLEVKRRLKSLLYKVPELDMEKEEKGKLLIYEINEFGALKEQLEECIKMGYNILIVDPIGFLVGEENDTGEVSKLMFELQTLCKKEEVNIILSHHLSKGKLKDVKSKWEMLDAIRGNTAWHNNSRYVWMIRRNKKHDDWLEVYNCKNSYGRNDNDYIVKNLFPSSDENIQYEKITLDEKGNVKIESEMESESEEGDREKENDKNKNINMFAFKGQKNQKNYTNETGKYEEFEELESIELEEINEDSEQNKNGKNGFVF